MSKTLIASAALGLFALGSAFSSAQAAPFSPAGISVDHSASGAQKVWWKRVCDRHGDRCHRVWIRNDYDRPLLRFRFGDRHREHHRGHDRY
jgi:hypothetical protein